MQKTLIFALILCSLSLVSYAKADTLHAQVEEKKCARGDYAACFSAAGYYIENSNKDKALEIAKASCAKEQNPVWLYLDEKVDQKDSACETITRKMVLPESYVSVAEEYFSKSALANAANSVQEKSERMPASVK